MSKRLAGPDGKLQSGKFGTPITTGDTTAGVWYRIVAKGGATALPTNAPQGYLVKTPSPITLAVGDSVEPWEGVDFCDVQSWSMEFEKASIDVTTLCDDVRTYRAGKTDLTGSLEGVMTVGITDAEGGFQNQFVTIAKLDAAQTSPDDYKVYPAQGAAIYAFLYTDKTNVTGEEETLYFLPLELTGFSASATSGDDAQTFTSGFRLAPSDVGVVFYGYKNQ